ncbi:cytochrome P450 [Nocardia transvalensis]|uniref:Cytochrome P450 n=1 Tax=Nocardia transvalensis TaxID=37333 RepID=A0A7W9ULH5_9NOCA|nr:cytochrome P450 [Nocardia transvalensis]MBB5917372.1 cytochrome P450 [Nocardia transvalensis]
MTSSPIDIDGPRVALYSPAFAADPHESYRQMRDTYGSLVPVELAEGVPATLVIGYRTAVRILHDPDHFPADPRSWQQNIPAGCPVKPMLEWRPNAIRSSGSDHLRYRQANVAAIAAVDLHGLHAIVEETAIPLIDAFCADGKADLLAQYATPLAFQVINTMLGCSPEIGQRVAAGIMAMFEGNDAADGNAMLIEALTELVAQKQLEPGEDITSRLVRHPAALNEREVVEQLVPLYGAGVEPTLNLIGNTLLSTLVDQTFAGDVLGGSLSTRDALDEVLFTDPPIANFCMTYPRHPILIEGVWLPAHQPVVISISACNNDPEISAGDHTGNRSHLAWGAGPHACPARQAAYLIAQDGVDQLLDALPDIRLAVPADTLTWRPGPFHRALAALPVVFPPSRPFGTGPRTGSAPARYQDGTPPASVAHP